MASVMPTQSSTPDTNPTNGPNAVSTYAYGPPVIDTRLPASAKQRTMSPIATVQARYASGAAAPTSAATPEGRRKMPPPIVTFTIPAASPQRADHAREPALALDARGRVALAHGCGGALRRNSASAFHVGIVGASPTRRANRSTMSPSCTAPLRSRSGRYSSDGWW